MMFKAILLKLNPFLEIDSLFFASNVATIQVK